MGTKIRLGALLGPITDGTATATLAYQASNYAAEGYRSIWSAQAIGRGFMVMDPFIALTVAATVTDNVEIGSAIIQLPLYHPMDLAHRVLSLQQICGDRLILGVGAGSTEKDFLAFGRDYAARFRVFNETLAALRNGYRAGSEENSTLTPWSGIERPPRIFYGTWGNGVERAARDFDGWIASGHYRTVDDLTAAAERYAAAGGGRSIVSTILLDGKTDLGELRERLARFAAAGFDDAVVMIHPGGPSAAAVRKLVD
jgi:alkanesulfonate monooxygenase SsuD/methylene tetrahydromethanopterin reductase-like flavin-dependent oxidoreductase (luciferase family)